MRDQDSGYARSDLVFINDEPMTMFSYTRRILDLLPTRFFG